MEKLFFNTSMPRSGSELLQVLLSQNPNIYASATSPLLEYQYGAMKNRETVEALSQNKELMDKAFTEMCKGMANSYYSAITDKPYVIDKSRGWSHYYEWVNKWNPNPKMICMIRDLRSVLASMEKIYRANRDKVSIDDPAKIQNMTVTQRIDYWLNTQPIGLALARTLDMIQKGNTDKVLFVKYEDLCNRPEMELKRIYEYLELPYYEDHEFDNLVKVVEEDCSRYGMFGDHNVKKEIQPVIASDWKSVYDDQISDYIKKSVEWYFKAFNY